MQDGALPNATEGGFIKDYEAFMSFMFDQAKNNPVEVAAFGLDNGTFFVQPWKGNLPSESNNNYWGFNEGGLDRTNIISQYHTHPGSSGPSRDDALRSSEWRIPVHTFGANGSIWRVNYTGFMVPIYPRGLPYGERIR